uniref:Uncharacterized protein n=1 Tax=Noctiluca scintillans TaxID=2966 RepID=A0A7S0ZUT9_NOCSC|mmetsp:Transcript_1982/g.5625  ORF Transcript_1982/g.5625 Transcript_1982/m.5625 type:complete len:271 (+) Transcript_1982:1-813(+)
MLQRVEAMTFATLFRTFLLMVRLLVAQHVLCLLCAGTASGTECLGSVDLTSERCCQILYNGNKSFYNKLTLTCRRNSCPWGTYFDEASSECVVDPGAECVEPAFADGDYEEAREGYVATCCNRTYNDTRPFYNYVKYKCTSYCPVPLDCVEPGWAYCVDPGDIATCSCPVGLQVNGTDRSCVYVQTEMFGTWSLVGLALIAFSCLVLGTVCVCYTIKSCCCPKPRHGRPPGMMHPYPMGARCRPEMVRPPSYSHHRPKGPPSHSYGSRYY